MRKIVPLLVVSILLVLCSPALQGQVSIFLNGQRAVRFEESPGIYHFVIPIYLKADGKEAPLPAPDTQPALRWIVAGVKAQMKSTPVDPSEIIPGSMRVTEKSVEFLPSEPKDKASRLSLASSEAVFTHPLGSESGMLGSGSVYYQFSFENICFDCAPTTALPAPLHPEQRDAEFQLFGESLKHFQAAWEHVRAISEQTSFEINPQNQPTATDVEGSMQVYAAMNRRLAELCPETAKTCLRRYEKYQACSEGSSPEDCGPSPACTAVCTIPGQVRDELKSGVCIRGGTVEFANLFPDWSPILRRQATEPRTRPPTMEASEASSRGVSLAGFMGLPKGMAPGTAGAPALVALGPTTCSVKTGYERARVAERDKAGEFTGLAAVAARYGGSLPGMPGWSSQTPYANLDGSARIGDGIAQNGILTQVPPVYPAIARAAHLTGVVVLHAMISKQGTVSQLSVISGPALLYAAAIDAVKQWTYRPYLVNGKPVEVDTTVTVNFNIAEPPPSPVPLPK